MSGVLEITELGMMNDIERLNTISNNLANVNTVGYKREIPVTQAFENILVDQIESAGMNVDDKVIDTRPIVQSHTDLSAGMFKNTGNSLDIAIEGEGFFEVTNGREVFYTRQGNLMLDASGRLTTSAGYVINGTGGEVRLSGSDPRIDELGRIWENEIQVGQLKLVNFTNPRQLEKLGSGLYKADQLNAQIMDDDTVRVRQGYLETSNVVMMNEMVQMMEVMRHFESSQRVIKGYDELLDNVIRTLGEF